MSLRKRLGLAGEPLYLMDGSAFVYRGYYAFQNMARSDGFPTNALYIVTRILLKMLREERPKHFAFVLDGKGPTFRKDLFEAYKAHRSATPEPLVAQIEPIKALMELLGVPLIVANGFEADDYIASLACRFREQQPVVIVGADKDLKQCLHQQVVMWDPASKDERVTTLASFIEETGMQPDSWPDYQAIIGDSSDNIPGVPQVGPKTAQGIIDKFPTLETLFAGLASLPAKVQARFAGMHDVCFMYRELTRLRTDVCTEPTLEDLSVRQPDMHKLLDFLQEYELRSLMREVASMERTGLFGPVTSPLAEQDPFASQEETRQKHSTKSKATSRRGTAGGQEQGLLLLAAPASHGAQPSPGHAPAQQPMGQGSLLDMASAPPAAPVVPVTVAIASTTAQLPQTGKRIALLPQGEHMLVASTTWQRIYTGPAHDLAQWLHESSAHVLGADTKALCTTYFTLNGVATLPWFDLSLAAYLLSPEERTYDFTQLVHRYAEQSASLHTVEEAPGLLALDLAEYLQEQLLALDLMPVFTGLEMPLVPVLARMEERGITLDTTAFSDFLQEVQQNLEQLTLRIYQQAGFPFNIRSSQQLADVLFTSLALPKAGKTKGGAMSTSQEALEKLQGKHPIINSLLEYRKLEKLRSTYLEPLPRLADAAGRIHTTFNQTATATGRLSSSNPNMQNIPVRGAFGSRMRACFIAAPEKVLVCADYSQIELRVLAHLSQDATLLSAFRNNEDIHTRTAGLLFDTPLQEVTPDQRRNAKTINFGLIYGMGAQKLAAELQIPMKEAKEFIERYFARFQRLKEFYDSIEEEARENGFVATMAGRRRLTPDLVSSNNQLRSQARRQAINTRIQGSAADIIKLAMIAVENDAALAALEARLLLQIHDELLLEVAPHNAEPAAKRLAELMEAVTPGSETLSVPLLVEAGIGHTWADAH
ncbi:DNA polymerase I [Desulfovibrio cuneatus]|uniref:DNA polymerase I n=1 Tax=Desulfovibrio cuneatus TaxID=159728 RepID=UPI000416E816|nr:DNA polymerase I [Desulfovibrio cuneatus]